MHFNGLKESYIFIHLQVNSHLLEGRRGMGSCGLTQCKKNVKALNRPASSWKALCGLSIDSSTCAFAGRASFLTQGHGGGPPHQLSLKTSALSFPVSLPSPKDRKVTFIPLYIQLT